MKYIKLKNDNKSFNFAKIFGKEIINLQDAEDVDNTISDLIKNNNKEIAISKELSYFSQDIIKKYNGLNDVTIIIGTKTSE